MVYWWQRSLIVFFTRDMFQLNQLMHAWDVKPSTSSKTCDLRRWKCPCWNSLKVSVGRESLGRPDWCWTGWMWGFFQDLIHLQKPKLYVCKRLGFYTRSWRRMPTSEAICPKRRRLYIKKTQWTSATERRFFSCATQTWDLRVISGSFTKPGMDVDASGETSSLGCNFFWSFVTLVVSGNWTWLARKYTQVCYTSNLVIWHYAADFREASWVPWNWDWQKKSIQTTNQKTWELHFVKRYGLPSHSLRVSACFSRVWW